MGSFQYCSSFSDAAMLFDRLLNNHEFIFLYDSLQRAAFRKYGVNRLPLMPLIIGHAAV